MFKVFDKNQSKSLHKQRRNSLEISRLLDSENAQIDFKLAKTIGFGGQGKVLKVPVIYSELDGCETTKWCVLKTIVDRKKNRSQILFNEEKHNLAITASDESSNTNHVMKLLTHVEYKGQEYSLYPYCESLLTELLKALSQQQEDTTLMSRTMIGIQVLLDLLVGLKAMHDLNIVHRDVKVSNIGLHISNDESQKNWCLFDLGISSVAVDDEEQSTWEGQAVGTVAFMHPKCFSKSYFCATKSNDIYGLGRVIGCILNKGYFDDLVKLSQLQNMCPFILAEDERFQNAQESFVQNELSLNVAVDDCIQQGLFFEALHYIFSRMTSINPSDIPQADELINIVSDLRNQYINFLEIREDEYKVLEENVLSSLLNNMDTENQSTTSGTASSFSASVDNKNHIDVLTYKDKQVLFSSTEAGSTPIKGAL